ncbi:MAG: hypothetical protein AMK73_03765 [Planctomycetes bacterium SM23_32]|nr:MAG: hypothetical protein AMK73_03765 [Planctomycetes bacterium SM23_32]
MSATEGRKRRPAAVPQADPEAPGDAGGPALRRPEEDIAHRPHLKVKPIGSRGPVGEHKPTVRRGTLFHDRENDAERAAREPKAGGRKPDWTAPKKIVLPSSDAPEVRFPFATHRPAPTDESAEEAELAAVTAPKAHREISTGFLLGLALLAIVLIGGVWLARLSGKVSALERRVSRAEAAQIMAAAGSRRAP